MHGKALSWPIPSASKPPSHLYLNFPRAPPALSDEPRDDPAVDGKVDFDYFLHQYVTSLQASALNSACFMPSSSYTSLHSSPAQTRFIVSFTTPLFEEPHHVW